MESNRNIENNKEQKRTLLTLSLTNTFLSPRLCSCAKFAKQISLQYILYYRKFEELSYNIKKTLIKVPTLVRHQGVEPWTFGLRVRCSTN